MYVLRTYKKLSILLTPAKYLPLKLLRMCTLNWLILHPTLRILQKMLYYMAHPTRTSILHFPHGLRASPQRNHVCLASTLEQNQFY